jgi:exosome complex component CSL4
MDGFKMVDIQKSGKFVIPGEKLGVIEEFMPNSGTHEEEGSIFSTRIGYLLLDHENKKASVYPKAINYNVPNVGNIVEGEIIRVHSSTVTIRINKIGEKFVHSSLSGIIYISDISFTYTDEISNAFKVSDKVRAKVISFMNGIFHLSTKEPNLGVVNSSCSICGNSLIHKGRNLQCKNCENIESRKTAIDYEVENL